MAAQPIFRSLFRGAVFAANKTQSANVQSICRNGCREWVGFGSNGAPHYVDRVDFPFPAVRFRENTNELFAIREKEKGDWRKLTCEEKKCLYRASFCQTFPEFMAPTGEWKMVLGSVLTAVSLSIWLFLGLKKYVSQPLPESFSEESRKVQLRRKLDLKMEPITGISSCWDYEEDDWMFNVKSKKR